MPFICVSVSPPIAFRFAKNAVLKSSSPPPASFIFFIVASVESITGPISSRTSACPFAISLACDSVASVRPCLLDANLFAAAAASAPNFCAAATSPLLFASAACLANAYASWLVAAKFLVASDIGAPVCR